MIELHRHGTIHEIRMARPPVNALEPELLAALRTALAAAEAEGARGIVLSSAARSFSGGMDVPHLMSLDEAGVKQVWRAFFDTARAIAGAGVPVVAAIGGHSPAGGCVLALCCDYRVMARGPFRIGLNEVQVGLVAPDAIQHLMRRVVGHYRAERLLVSGELVDSEQAHAIGLVDELTDADHVVTRALHWLEALLALPSAAMLHTRRIARADLLAALDGFDDAQLDGFMGQWRAPETQAALSALVARLRK